MPSSSSSKTKRDRSRSKSKQRQHSSPKKSTAKNAPTTTLPSSGFLVTCDPPVKQFIKCMNDEKSVDKKFIIEDLDATHLLIEGKARKEILRKVEEWMDDNVFSNVERVGESLET
mmetsp:Transcript_17397/g.23988  ORF Transcript_17397/g.23988 Transcript_17397/m.23988 type:complete len:115 (-) Transcript_17397:66-410(-)